METIIRKFLPQIILIPFLDFLKKVFLYQYYAFSLLLSLHYNSMICNPMHFKEYTSFNNVFSRVLCSSIVSILLSLDDLFAFLYTARFLKVASFQKWGNLNNIMIIMNSVKFIMIKIAYTVILAIIAYKIKNALKISQNVRNQDKKNSIPALFIVFCFISLFNNFLYWCSDIPIMIFNYLHERWINRWIK